MTAINCYKITTTRERAEKTESCEIDFAEDTVTVHGYGGVGDYIQSAMSATDAGIHTTTEVCSITVKNPGKHQ